MGSQDQSGAQAHESALTRTGQVRLRQDGDTKALIWELDHIGVPSIIFDYHGEYASGTFRDALRPQVFDVMAGLPINPFELPLDPLTGKKRPPVEMVFRLADALNSTFRGSGDIQLGLLREAIEECYRRQGFDLQTDATWENDPPSLSMLAEVLEEWSDEQGAQVRSLQIRLQPLFKSGIFSQANSQFTFDDILGRTTVIVMTSGIRDLMLAASRFLLQKIYSSMLMRGMTDRLRAMVCIDEAHKLCGDEVVTPLIREARKYGFGLILSSHQVRDFEASVLANTGTIIALELEDADATAMSRYLGADKGSQQAARQIIMAQSGGQALVRSQHYQPYAQVQVRSFEERFVQATPADPAATLVTAEDSPPKPEASVMTDDAPGKGEANSALVVKPATKWVGTRSVGTDTLYTVADLFCGAGGFSAGFEAAGYRPVLGIDCDSSALESYRYNHMDARAILARVEDLADEQIVASLDGRTLDVLCGGPPCQGFSVAGRRDADDPRNQLFQQFVRTAGILQPHFLVMENVPGILSFEGGRVVEEIRRSLAEAGYPGASVVKLNAADHGVPQLRERVFIVANRWGLPNPYPLPLLQPPDYVTVGEALDPLLDCPRDPRANHIWLDHDAETVERLAPLKPGESLHNTYKGSWQRLVLNRPAPTIKTNNGGSAVHPTLPRVLSTREMATLQSFPHTSSSAEGYSPQGSR